MPDFTTDRIIHKCGDNIYKPISKGQFKQLQSMHSNGMHEDPRSKSRDLGGKNVLVSKRFYYFGSEAIELPPELHALKVGRAHRNRFSIDMIVNFLRFMKRYRSGIHAAPVMWSANDKSMIAREKSCRSC